MRLGSICWKAFSGQLNEVEVDSDSEDGATPAPLPKGKGQHGNGHSNTLPATKEATTRRESE